MAGNADGSIVIQVDLSSNDAENELSRLKKKFLHLTEDLSSGRHKKDALTQKIDSYKKEIAKLQSNTDVASYIDNAGRMDELKTSVAETEKELERQNRALEDTQMKIDGVKLRYNEVKAAAAQIGQATTVEQDVSADINSSLTRTQAALLHIKEQIRSSFDFSHAKEDLKSLFSMFGSMVGKIAAGAAKITFNVAKKGVSALISGLKSCASYIGKIFSGSKSVSKSFGGIGSAVKRIAPALLATEGVIGILRKAVNAYMQQNQQLANTLNGVWAGLGNIMGPVIDRMVNLLANAIAYFTKFLNLLGFTGKAASKQISGAGGAAKKETDKLKKQMMSFDELNILQDNESDSGGGGGGGADAGITPNVQLPDWAQLMAQQLRSAQWAEAATTLTTALNNMVDSVDWAGVGAKIGSWLNGAMTFLATAINTFDWQGLGGSLATSVNNLVSSVDWSNLGTILAGKFKIVISTLAGFILNLDMVELAHAASNIVISFFNSITDTIVNTDWYAIGEQVKTFLVSVDWEGIATAVFEAIGAAFVSMAEFIGGLISDAVIGIRDYFKEYIDKYIAMCPDDENLGNYIIAGILEGIANAVMNIGTWIYENMFKPFMDGFKEAFGIHSPSTVMAEQGGYIIDGLLNGITGAWQRVKDWFSKALSDIKNAFSNAWASIRNTTANIWNGIVDAIRGAVNGVIRVINRMISTVVDGINSLFSLLSFNIDLPGGQSIGLSLPQFSAPQIPYLAQGAVIPPNAPFLAMLGDQRHGTNVEAPLSTIKDAVTEVTAGREQLSLLREQNDLLRQILERSGVYLDGRKIAESVTRHQRQMQRSMGY